MFKRNSRYMDTNSPPEKKGKNKGSNQGYIFTWKYRRKSR